MCATLEMAGKSSNAAATRANSAADDHPIPNRNASHAVIDRDPSSRHPSWASKAATSSHSAARAAISAACNWTIASASSSTPHWANASRSI